MIEQVTLPQMVVVSLMWEYEVAVTLFRAVENKAITRNAAIRQFNDLRVGQAGREWWNTAFRRLLDEHLPV